MADSFRQIALINIIRTDSDFHQIMHQLFHNGNAVIYTGQNHGLVADRHPGVDQLLAGFLRFHRDFDARVEMRIQPDGMILFQNAAKLVGNPLREDDRGSCADPDDFHVRDRTEVFQNIFKNLIVNKKAVPPLKSGHP